MSTLTVMPIENQVFLSATAEDITTYHVSEKKGSIQGVAVSVSGEGAWAKMSGSFSFKIRNINNSKTYQSMKKEYSISGGVSAFWSWLGIKANAETHKEEIKQMFQEVQTSEEQEGTVSVELLVTGMYPNVEVTASAYIFVLQVTDSSGNTFNISSSEDPGRDIRAQDANGDDLPVKNNTSTITL